MKEMLKRGQKERCKHTKENDKNYSKAEKIKLQKNKISLDFQTSNCVVDSNIKIYLNLNIQIFKFKCFFFF